MSATHHLFGVTRFLLRLATLFSLFLIAVLSLAAGALALAAAGFWHLPVPDLKELSGIPVGEIIAVASLAIVTGVICIALAAYMFLLTARIIDTAQSGDPFVTENANRLKLIAWLLLAIQVIGSVADALANMLPDKIKDHAQIGFNGFSASGILAVLLIFVLAQIFRRGSEMRAELEGTV